MAITSGLHMWTTASVSWSFLNEKQIQLLKFNQQIYKKIIKLTAFDFVIAIWAVGHVITTLTGLYAVTILTRKSTFSAHWNKC